MRRYVLVFGTHRVRLTSGVWHIGRDPSSEIVLAHPSVSRRHATLWVSPEHVELIDAGSRNGVSVNARRVWQPTQLEPGDCIEVGPVSLRLEDADRNDEHHAPVEFTNAETRPLPSSSPPRVDPIGKLSPRELDVFRRIARGETQRSIAETLGLSVKTIETHRARIGEKLGIRDRAELVRLAIEAGVLRVE